MIEPGDRVKVVLQEIHEEEGMVGNFHSCWVKDDYPVVLDSGRTVWVNKNDITLTHRSAGLKLL